jgi:hypothetical protein
MVTDRPPRGAWADPLLAVSDAYAALSAAARAEIRDQARLHAFRDRPAVAVRIGLKTGVLVGVPGLAGSVLASLLLPGLWGSVGSGLCIGGAGFAAHIVQDRLRAPWLAPFVHRLALEHPEAAAPASSGR